MTTELNEANNALTHVEGSCIIQDPLIEVLHQSNEIDITPEQCSQVKTAAEDEASDETIRKWLDRPAPIRMKAIQTLIKQCTNKTPEFHYLCRQETTNGIFEGDHNDQTTCGVTTTSVGKSISMQSFDCDHTFGIIQDGHEFIYEGELRVNVPHGYGAGYYANGERFVGIWSNGRPCGLGCLTSAISSSFRQYGWFYNSTAMYEWRERDVVVSLPPKPNDQPELGLFTMCRLLETSRLRRFRQVLDKWIECLCYEAEATAIQSRTIAFMAWTNGCAAQQASIRNEGLQLHSHGTNDEIFSKVKALTQQEKKLEEKNEIRQARLQHAITTQVTTITCLGIERRSCELVQEELDTLETELQDAKNAEMRCIAIQHEIASIRRQIEDGKVQLNAMKQARRQAVATPTTNFLERKPSIILMPAFRRRSSAKVYVDAAPQDTTISFVCGVEGCTCGVAKDAFQPHGDGNESYSSMSSCNYNRKSELVRLKVIAADYTTTDTVNNDVNCSVGEAINLYPMDKIWQYQ